MNVSYYYCLIRIANICNNIKIIKSLMIIESDIYHFQQIKLYNVIV